MIFCLLFGSLLLWIYMGSINVLAEYRWLSGKRQIAPTFDLAGA